MQVTIEVKKLIDLIENHNPEADLTGLKAYLFDLVLGPSSRELPGPVHTPTAPPAIKTKPAKKEPVAVQQAVEAATVSDGTSSTYNPYVDDLSPHPPANLQPETFDLEGEGAADPVAAIAKKAIGSVAPSPPPPTRGGKKSIKDRKAEREAKRKEVANFANMSSKEIMEQLTSRALPKLQGDQKQFVDLGADDEEPTGGEIEMG